MRRSLILVLLAFVLALMAACTNKKVNNPLANVGSKQPDKVLFDRAMDALKHNRFDVARMTLQTLINTYPDSEYIARAKLAVADSWYAEGGSTALQQAEIEYKDFKTFFPNLPEAAEAQLKVANIHYQEMEKPDRDYTHALRAETEYRALIQEYPDSKLVPEAKERLREVQEVLAEREYLIGHFYYMRQSYPASIARLQTLVDRYPLFSGADEALYLIGQNNEGEIARVRQAPTCSVTSHPIGCISEDQKAKMIDRFAKDAAVAYGHIITRYPAEDRALDAKARLEALHQPVPRPTRAALELNKKEVASRQEPGMISGVIRNFEKHPDVGMATKVGEPTMVNPTPTSATDVVQAASRATMGGPGGGGDNKVTVETMNGPPAPNQAAPRSDAPPAPANDQAAPVDTANQQPAGEAAPGGAGELKPNVADPNELKPNVEPDANALPPLLQNNELANDGAAGAAGADASSSSSKQNSDELADISSSRKKKKKGMGKLNPF